MRFVVVAVFVGTKRESSTSIPSDPLTLALSPNTFSVLGERVGIRENADPGRPQRLLPLVAPWAKFQRPDGALKGGSEPLPLHKCPNLRAGLGEAGRGQRPRLQQIQRICAT